MKTAVVAGFVAAACVVGLTAGSALAQDAKAGAEIYTKAGCAKCHGDSGAGDGAMGLKLKDKPSNWAAGGGGLKDLDDAKIAESRKKGGGAIGRSRTMPPNSKLSAAGAATLCAYRQTLKT